MKVPDGIVKRAHSSKIHRKIPLPQRAVNCVTAREK